MWGELSAVAAVVACAAAGSVPNVLILLTDDVGWGDVGYNCKNATVCPQTPNIDALATGDHAVLFHRFYSGAGVCSPTRASVRPKAPLPSATPDKCPLLLCREDGERTWAQSVTVIPMDPIAVGTAGCG